MGEGTVKAEYGPTLGQLLAPRWRAASLPARTAVTLVILALVAGLVGIALTLQSASFSHGGSLPFSFSYRGLFRVAPDPGGYVKVEQHRADGSLKYSYAVEPLRLPAYTGELGGAIPVFAAGYIRALAGRSRGFELRGEGKAKVNGVPAYQVLYTLEVEGREMLARNVLLLPERAGAREGVVIVLLASRTASKQVTSPLEVASTGVLAEPLKSFSFG